MACALAAAGCASGGKSGTGGNTGQFTGAVNSPLTQPVPFSVSAGQLSSGINVTLSSPAGTALNINALGVNALGLPSGGSAFNSGDVIHQSQTATILIFGAGLAAGQTVSISGPADITITNVRAVTAQNNTPGLAFDVAVSSSAAIGARSVIVTNTNGDVTAFTAGLEVEP